MTVREFGEARQTQSRETRLRTENNLRQGMRTRHEFVEIEWVRSG